ncbi:MAG: tetratricopeptide repeat protein [Leadbetterella sp.]
MPKSGTNFNDYIYRLFTRIVDHHKNTLRESQKANYRCDFRQNYSLIFTKDKGATPKHKFTNVVFKQLYEYFLSDKKYKSWEDFETQEKRRWMHFGSPNIAEWDSLIHMVLEEIYEDPMIESADFMKKNLEDKLLIRVISLETQGALNEAIIEIEKCIQLNPRRFDILLKAVELYIKKGKTEESLNILDYLLKNVKSQEYRQQVMLKLAKVYLKVFDQQDNIEYLRNSENLILILLQELKHEVIINMETLFELTKYNYEIKLKLGKHTEAKNAVNYLLDRCHGLKLETELDFKIEILKIEVSKSPISLIPPLWDRISLEKDPKFFYLKIQLLHIWESCEKEIPKKIQILLQVNDEHITEPQFDSNMYLLLYKLATLFEQNKQPKKALEYYVKFLRNQHIDYDLKLFLIDKTKRLRDMIDYKPSRVEESSTILYQRN